MTTRGMSLADLQNQIEELSALIERQSNQAQLANEQIAALQAASEAAARAPAIQAPAAAVQFPKIPDLIRLVPEFDRKPPKSIPMDRIGGAEVRRIKKIYRTE